LKPNAVNLDDLARNALIEDVLRLKNGVDFVQETSKIELFSLGNGQITENRHLDLSDLPDEEADYEAVPVQAFGKALLRGLGWKEGQPIGKNVKNIVAPVITAPRPKGLGLGAEIPKPGSKKSGETSQTVRKDEDELVLKIGSYFKTVKEEYGQVIGLDDDNARIIGRLTLSKSTLSLSQHGVRLVTKDEYEKFSKCINKEKYDKYKKEEDEKESKRRRNDDESRTKRSDDRRRSPKRRKSPKKERKRSSERRHSSKSESTKRSQ
jgi:G patch domain/KOW motif-containing protein